MNSVMLIGRLTKDIELKTNNGNTYTKFTLAVNRPTSRAGQEDTDFIRCTVFDKIAENMERYCGKGTLLAVEGQIRTSQYKDQEGKTVYSTDVLASRVHFLSWKSKDEGEVDF